MPRKRVGQNVLDAVPELKEHERIVQLEKAVGKHLYEVRFPDGAIGLCRMPPKFRNTVWIRRGTPLARSFVFLLLLRRFFCA